MARSQAIDLLEGRISTMEIRLQIAQEASARHLTQHNHTLDTIQAERDQFRELSARLTEQTAQTAKALAAVGALSARLTVALQTASGVTRKAVALRMGKHK